MYGFKILCEISKVPFEISHKILNPYTAKYAFYRLLFFFVIYDILELWRHKLSETAPRSTLALDKKHINSIANYVTGWYPWM